MAQPHHKQPVKQLMAQPDHNQALLENNLSQVPTSQPKRDTKAPVKLDLCDNYLLVIAPGTLGVMPATSLGLVT